MTFNYKEIGIILLKSIKHAFKWNIWKWFTATGIGMLTGFILPIGKEYFKWNSISVLIITLIIVIILFLTRFVLIFLKESIRYFHEQYKNCSYGDAIILLKESFAEAHYYRKTPGFQEQDFMKSMIVFCNNLKLVYDKITSSTCSVSIKVPITDNQVGLDTVLMNLTRDSKHRSRDTTEYLNIKHTIIGNTAFTNCWNNVINNRQKKGYINNEINNTENYENTSKQCYEKGVLPYNSELVQPIVPLKTIKGNNFDCHGFICVDSDTLGAFDGKYDLAIIEGVADGIYDLIMEKNNHKNDKS